MGIVVVGSALNTGRDNTMGNKVSAHSASDRWSGLPEHIVIQRSCYSLLDADAAYIQHNTGISWGGVELATPGSFEKVSESGVPSHRNILEIEAKREWK